MEYPRSLMFVLGVLAFFFCFDIFVFIEATDFTAKLIIGLFFAGRIAAMWGVITRRTIGWWFAFGYLFICLAFSLLSINIITTPLYALSVVFLIAAKSEFE